MKVPLTSNGLRNKDIVAAIKVLKSGKLTIGSNVKLFEKSMAKYLGVKHFIMVNSGSSANLAIIEALLRPTFGKPLLKAGDGVIVPAIAWPTTIWPLLQLGLKPFFVDVNLENLSLNLEKARELIEHSENRIRAIFPIHPLGFGINHNDLKVISSKYDLIVINDVCESLGSWNGDIHAGTQGVAGTFSFYFSHHLTTMEGGGIATQSDAIADDLRSIRSHGWSRDRFDKVKVEKRIDVSRQKYLFVTTGFNIRPMEIQAAIGISQLKNLDKFIDRRRSIVERVADALRGKKMFVIGEEYLRDSFEYKRHSWMLLPIRIHLNNPKIRAEVVSSLEKFGIENRPVLTGNFLNQPALRHLQNRPNSSLFRNAQIIENSSFLVSCHHDLTDKQVKYLIDRLLIIEKQL